VNNQVDLIIDEKFNFKIKLTEKSLILTSMMSILNLCYLKLVENGRVHIRREREKYIFKED
jgi:hypothetical protein